MEFEDLEFCMTGFDLSDIYVTFNTSMRNH